MSCCAPLILPALLSFVGFSGMTLLQVNVAVHDWATPLTIASICFMLLAIVLVSRTITAACTIVSRPGTWIIPSRGNHKSAQMAPPTLGTATPS